jgi:hypothetical protein
MKRKLSVCLIVLALGLIFLGPQSAQAGTWALASISEVGKSLSQSVVILTHVSSKPVFKNKYFRFNSANNKDMLAVALTAASMGKNVKIFINQDGVTIDGIRMVNN